MVDDLLTEGSTSSHTMAGCIDLAPHRLTAGGGMLVFACVFLVRVCILAFLKGVSHF